MAEQKNNKGFGALDDLSSDIDEKSSNTKPQTAVKKTTAPKVKKSFPPVRKKNVKAIKKSPAIKRKQEQEDINPDELIHLLKRKILINLFLARKK